MLARLFLFVGFSVFSFVHFNCDAQAKLWGMTSLGGSNNSGLIFNAEADASSPKNQSSFFNGSRGSSPTGGLTLYNNSKLYGMTVGDGANFGGVLFEYDPVTSLYTVKFDFDFTNAANGRNPGGNLTLSNNGKMYGTTQLGGKYDLGVLFEYDPVINKLTKRLDFERTANGSYPCDLTASSDGKLYGLTRSGGTKGHGVLFEFNPNNNTFVKKIDFDGKGNGSYPVGSLTFGNNGKLYGVTAFGGVNGYSVGTSGYGVIFEYDPIAGTVAKRVDFDLTARGAYPMASLTLGVNGKLYGTTYSGGLNLVGVLFEFDPSSNQFIKKVDFEVTKTGGEPLGALLADKQEILIGTTTTGGSSSNGVLFEFNSVTGVLVKRFDFDGKEKGGRPRGNLTFGNNGRVYGMTQFGGGNLLQGVIFEYDALTKGVIKKIDFGNFNGGKNPVGNLYQGKGKLFGLSNFGGDNNAGTLFDVDLVDGTLTKKADFGDADRGQYPTGSLVSGNNGKLYSTTSGGGKNLAGVLFEYDTSLNKVIKKVDFDSINGSRPVGDLILASNGKLYGTTSMGGKNSRGVLFEYDLATSQLTKKIDFDGKVKGDFPRGNLIIASNEKIYGVATYGGIYNQGVIFEYDMSTNVYSKKIDFDSASNGALPYGGLVLNKDGKVYGMTTFGGIRNLGILFEYIIETNTLSKIVDFDGITTGAYPIGGLTLSGNGNLYGMTSAGGINNSGILFEFNPTTNLLSKKFDFVGSNGSMPLGGLLLVKVTPELVWSDPMNITYGTSLNNGQMNAQSNIAGKFEYNPPAGTILNVGVQELSVKFTPADLANYSVVSKKVKLIVEKANQQITFPAISDKQLTDASFGLTATATSGLPVLFASSTTSKVTVNNNQATIVAGGRVIIVASQPGNANYNAAASVSQTFCIKPAKPTISVSLASGNVTLTSSASGGYKWFLNGALIPNANGQSYIATLAGAYKVQVNLDDCLSDLSNDVPVVITGDLPTGNAFISLYPNPTAGSLFIAGLEPETNEYSIVDLLGRPIIMNLEKSGDQHLLTTESLVDGVYMLRVKQSNSVFQLKFVKKN
jgi:uncharacterized repeat protein (TIGR03803 family)